MLQPGDTIADTWSVVRGLGRGTVGSVYLAHRIDDPSDLAAIKLLSAQFLSSPTARARFTREGQILRDMRHPNVMHVRGVHVDGDSPYLEMEVVEGEDLTRKLAHGALPLAEALGLAEQLLTGLAHLHQQNIAHRDLKPSHLIVQADGVLKLVDFGLAVRTDAKRITMDGTQFGTAAYAPPEWVAPERPDPMSWDLYAAGVLLYEMITGRRGFTAPVGASPWEAAAAVMEVKATTPSLDPGDRAPEPVCALVRAWTCREPEGRPRSADAALQALRQVQQLYGRPSVATRVSLWLNSKPPVTDYGTAPQLSPDPAGGGWSTLKLTLYGAALVSALAVGALLAA